MGELAGGCARAQKPRKRTALSLDSYRFEACLLACLLACYPCLVRASCQAVTATPEGTPCGHCFRCSSAGVPPLPTKTLVLFQTAATGGLCKLKIGEPSDGISYISIPSANKDGETNNMTDLRAHRCAGVAHGTNLKLASSILLVSSFHCPSIFPSIALLCSPMIGFLAATCVELREGDLREEASSEAFCADGPC